MTDATRTFTTWFAFALYAAILGTVAVWRVWLMIPSEFDLGYQVWAIHQVGVDGLDAVIPWSGISVVGNHLSLLIPLLAPFGQFDSLPIVLTLLQVLAITSAAVIVLCAADKRHTPLVAALITVGAALHPGTLYAAFWDVHMNVLGLPLIVAFLVFVALGRPLPALAMGLLSIGVREDIALVVVAVALVNWRRLGRGVTAALTVAGLAVPFVWASAGGNAGAVSIFGFVDLADPVGTLRQALSNLGQGGFVLSLTAILALPWIFLPKPDWRIAAPVVIPHAMLLVSDTPVTRSIGFHYYIVPIFAVAAAVALRSPDDSSTRTRSPLLSQSTRRAGAIVSLGLLIVIGPLGTSVVSREYTRNSVVALLDDGKSQRVVAAEMRAALSCLESIRPVGVLAVEGEYVPWLTGVELRVLPHPFEDYRFASGRSDVVLLDAEETVPVALLVLASTGIPDGYEQDPWESLVYWPVAGSERCNDSEMRRESPDQMSDRPIRLALLGFEQVVNHPAIPG